MFTDPKKALEECAYLAKIHGVRYSIINCKDHMKVVPTVVADKTLILETILP